MIEIRTSKSDRMCTVRLRHELIDAFMKVKDTKFTGNLKVLYELSYDKFFKALYIGYEVEPEFKVGDWVVNTSNGYIKLIENEREANFLNNDYIKRHELRHATPEEIAE